MSKQEQSEDRYVEIDGWKAERPVGQPIPKIVGSNPEAIYEYDVGGDDESQANGDQEAHIDSELGEVSPHWRRILFFMVGGSVLFAIAGLGLIAAAYTHSTIAIYTVAGLAFAYLLFRIGLSYSVYKDAKILGYHTEKRREEYQLEGYGWEPRPILWAVLFFSMPPFATYGPGAAYLFKRRRTTGHPKLGL